MAEYTGDLTAWAADFDTSFNAEDPASGAWSNERYAAHTGRHVSPAVMCRTLRRRLGLAAGAAAAAQHHAPGLAETLGFSAFVTWATGSRDTVGAAAGVAAATADSGASAEASWDGAACTETVVATARPEKADQGQAISPLSQ